MLVYTYVHAMQEWDYFMRSKKAAESIGVREFRSNLASYLRDASLGHRIIITSDGKNMAELGPINGGSLGISLEALIATGLIEAPAQAIPATQPANFQLPTGVNSQQILKELRGR